MTDIVRIEEQDDFVAKPTQGGEPGRGRVRRANPAYLVRIGGRDLKDEFLTRSISSIEVDERARGLSKATIRFQNANQAFTDHELLRGEDLEVEIYTGWGETRLVRRGLYRASVPRHSFDNAAMPTITLECWGEEWPLAVNEERRTYENLTDSQIAGRIAARNRLQVDADPTTTIHEHVAQVNETDMEFLERRALLHGFDVYVEDGVLHFHEPRFEHAGITLVVGKGSQGSLARFHVEADPWDRGIVWARSGMDRLTGTEWEFKTTDSATSGDVARQIVSRGGAGFRTAADLAPVAGRRPQRFIVGEGHEGTEAEGRRQVEAFSRASEWVVTSFGAIRGVEKLSPRKVILISGVGHHSGEFYVTRATHRIEGFGRGRGGYSMTFEATRPGTGALVERARGGRGGRNDVTQDVPNLGEVVVA